MMLKSSMITQNTLGAPIGGHGLPCGFVGQTIDSGHEAWNAVSDNYMREDHSSNGENASDEAEEITTAHWAIVEEEPEEPANGFPEEEEPKINGGTRMVETSLKLDPVPTKTGENDLEWKLVPDTTVVSTRKIYLPRSLSLTEKELREAQSLSDNNSSQLSPTGSCSRGAQLFHRRRQKIKAFEERKLAQQSHQQDTKQPSNHQVHHGTRISDFMKEESNFGSEQTTHLDTMEENSVDPGNTVETYEVWVDEAKETDYLPLDNRAPSPSASEEDHQEPLSAYLKETLVVSSSKTNGLVIENNEDTEAPDKKEPIVTQNKQYCEVHLTLSKPVSVSNRTARPFGGQVPIKRNVYSEEKSPTIELPPPPTYAETLSSPPPVTRVRSPPAYSALYPNESQHFTPVQQVTQGEMRLTPQPKSGILDNISARRGPKKSMFTFIEKPKVAPNPELLSMVQNSDERRKHRNVSSEDETFILGAEASNFQHNKPPSVSHNVENSNAVQDWSSSLKSPGVQTKPPVMPIHQALTEDKGKGAELFARRQSRMERFVLETPASIESIRSPSPAMSLPPSWKCSANARGPPSPFINQSQNNQRSLKSPSTTHVPNNSSESAQSQKELDISKRQPYQLQPSLFILSPTKDPLSSLPKAAPPPKPMVMESYRLTRQSSCPTSPLVPSPTVYSPSYFQAVHSPSPVGVPHPAADNPPPFGRMTPTNHVGPVSPTPFSTARVSSPRSKMVIQVPRPSFSAKNAGMESQKFKEFVPGTTSNRMLQHRRSLDGWGTSSLPSFDEGSLIQSPASPAWSDRSPSPSPIRMENDPRMGNQMKALLARNIINAARRKSSSSWGVTSPQSPLHITSPWSPPVGNGSSLPATPRGRRSPTGSDISMESEDSGAKSPGFRNYPLSPRGWYGSLRVKRDSLPSSSPFSYTP